MKLRAASYKLQFNFNYDETLKMTFERVVGLQVSNDEVYSQYRAAMLPLLLEHGGGFRYDFRVSEVLKNEEGKAINRLFLIYFESREKREAFFSNSAYLEIRQKYFDASVDAATIVSSYDRD